MDKRTIPNNAGERIKILRQLDNMILIYGNINK